MKKQDFKVLKTKDLYPFPDNPFHVAEDETLSELAESIKEFGIVTPIITRPKEDGNGYEVIAGQRRVRASELAGINTVPAFVLPLDRDRAIITLVDSNLQRENILPSERAFAYKMKSEAMKRQGFRTDLTSSQVVTKLRTDDKVAQGFGVGRMTVQRFIRLTELIPPILRMVDEGKIALTPAVELSFLKKDEQENLFATMESEEATPSLSQAQRMKQLSQSGRLDMDTIFAIMTEEKGNQKETLKINTSFIVQYRITKLLKSTLFVKLPAIRFHILTSFLVGKLVVLPPFSRGNTAFFKNAEDFLKFLQKFFERTKCARPKSPDGRIGIVSSIQMIRQFIYISVVSPGGGRAFFDKSITVGFCRYAFCFMAAPSFSRRFQQ